MADADELRSEEFTCSNGVSLASVSERGGSCYAGAMVGIDAESSWIPLGHLGKEPFLLQLLQQAQIDELFGLRFLGLGKFVRYLIEQKLDAL